MSPRQAESNPHYNELFLRAKREEKVNEREVEQTRSRVLRYGMVVQLQHAVSHGYLYVSGTPSESVLSSGCLVACSKYAGSVGCFRVIPKLQQVHCEGERVHVGDPCILEHVETGMRVALGRLSDGRAMYEVIGNPSQGAMSSFKLMRYRGHAEAASLSLNSGTAAHIIHKEARGCIGVTQESSTLTILETDDQHRVQKSTNGIFVIERLEAHDGSTCVWNDKFRIRHLATGRLLSLEAHHTNPITGEVVGEEQEQSVTVDSALGGDTSLVEPLGAATDATRVDSVETNGSPRVSPQVPPPAEANRARENTASKFAALASSAANGAANSIEEKGEDALAVEFHGSLGLKLADVEERRGNEALLGETVFTLEPLYSSPDSNVEANQYFGLRSTALGGLWVYLSSQETEGAQVEEPVKKTSRAVRTLRASSKDYEQDIFVLQVPTQETLIDLDTVIPRAEPLQDFVDQIMRNRPRLDAQGLPDRRWMDFAAVTKTLEELIMFTTTATYNTDPIAREGLPYVSRQHILHEQGILELALSCIMLPFEHSHFKFEELDTSDKSKKWQKFKLNIKGMKGPDYLPLRCTPYYLLLTMMPYYYFLLLTPYYRVLTPYYFYLLPPNLIL